MLKLKTKRTPVIVEYREDNDNLNSEVLAIFETMPLTPSEIVNLLKDNTSDNFVKIKGGKGYERVQDPNLISITHKKIDKVIIGWTGVVDENGAEIECTKENKINVFELNEDIIRYVLDKADEAGKVIEETEEKEVKN